VQLYIYIIFIIENNGDVSSENATVSCFVFARWRSLWSWRTDLLSVVKWLGLGVYLLVTSVSPGQLYLAPERRPEWNFWHAERFPSHSAFTALSIFNFFCPTSASILRRICVYQHVSDSVRTAYEAPLLANNTVGEIFFTEEVWSVDWIFIVGVPAWRRMAEYVTLDKMFYNLLFKQK
jgi:hypothetical protein